MSKFQDFCLELESDIKRAYEEAISTEEAERLAAKFLLAQIQVGRELSSVDLDTRTKKVGLKAFRAVVYLEQANKYDKKPTEAALAAYIDSDQLVVKEQTAYDAAEVGKAELENYLHVFRDAHIFFRGIAKGKFD